MAILSKIRERSMFLIIIIGLALFAFVLDPSTLGDFFNSNKVNEVGEVNGEAISTQEFAKELEAYKQQTGGRVSEMQAAKTVWDNIVRKKIYKNQLEEAGITVGEQDVWNEVINSPSVSGSPQFQNEAGMFDEAKFKQFLADTKNSNDQLWSAWSNYMNQIKNNAETNTYNKLVTAGLGASLKEGENEYMIENTKMNAQFVYVPYTTISDSLVKIKKSEVEAYIKNNKSQFQVDASRDISYVKFDIVATPEDEEAIKNDIAELVNDLKSTSNYKEFLDLNGSDDNLDLSYKFNANINQTVANEIFAGNEGDVYGPYKDQNKFKISKIVEVSKMPDSVKASHILIPFVGAQRATPDVTRTKEEAQVLADSILTVVKARSSKFSDLAKEFSSDKSNADKGGELDWFNYNRMTPAFRDFSFTNKKGTIDVVETPFGFHVVKIDETKNEQKVLKLATFSRNIVPSEKTENEVFQKAEQFALAISNNSNYTEVAKENNYNLRPAIGLKVLDENVPGLGNQRPIVSWAFGRDVEEGDFKRFDLEGSHVVAVVTNKTEKGLMPVEKAINRVRPILLNEKKAALISEKMKGDNLQEIAKANNTTVRTATNVNLKNATLSGVGAEPKVVGAMYAAPLNKTFNDIEGSRGVFAFTVTSRELPTALPNYETNRKKIAEARKRLTFKMYEALKESSDIEDNRANMYVSN
ncbi:peptidylprolyl isomerase [Polaribacter aestuariivivens]|uniref:Periplasmic chaperone PpiD n=1 Tax=Polaribacter aestuariivivens TaxID=2304626 RepID=A0A5S3N9W4_9FLAO|nr:peptidylprolyl isomerase [Polaribacter aestuariivivens]TMM32081.1 peptidylprolyl isomerase [Polaribacter aestuariivivens]